MGNKIALATAEKQDAILSKQDAIASKQDAIAGKQDTLATAEKQDAILNKISGLDTTAILSLAINNGEALANIFENTSLGAELAKLYDSSTDKAALSNKTSLETIVADAQTRALLYKKSGVINYILKNNITRNVLLSNTDAVIELLKHPTYANLLLSITEDLGLKVFSNVDEFNKLFNAMKEDAELRDRISNAGDGYIKRMLYSNEKVAVMKINAGATRYTELKEAFKDTELFKKIVEAKAFTYSTQEAYALSENIEAIRYLLDHDVTILSNFCTKRETAEIILGAGLNIVEMVKDRGTGVATALFSDTSENSVADRIFKDFYKFKVVIGLGTAFRTITKYLPDFPWEKYTSILDAASYGAGIKRSIIDNKTVLKRYLSSDKAAMMLLSDSDVLVELLKDSETRDAALSKVNKTVLTNLLNTSSMAYMVLNTVAGRKRILEFDDMTILKTDAAIDAMYRLSRTVRGSRTNVSGGKYILLEVSNGNTFNNGKYGGITLKDGSHPDWSDYKEKGAYFKQYTQYATSIQNDTESDDEFKYFDLGAE